MYCTHVFSILMKFRSLTKFTVEPLYNGQVGQGFVIWRYNLYCIVLCTSANCPLYGGVRYWECPLREVPLCVMKFYFFAASNNY